MLLSKEVSNEEKFKDWEEKYNHLKDKVENQEKRIYFLEKCARQRNIIFFGLQEEESSYSDLENIFIGFIEKHFGIKLEIRDIQEILRLGKKGKGPRPVKVTFITLGRKIEIFKQKRKLDNTEYYIKEDYPKYVLEKRKELQGRIKIEKEKGNKAVIKYDKLIILHNKSETYNNKKRMFSTSPETNTSNPHKITDRRPQETRNIKQKTHSSLQRLLEFKHAISTIKYDIIGLSEIRRTGYNIEETEDHIFCHFGETKGKYGVGFLIKKHLKNNIECFTAKNERICTLHLNYNNTALSIIQVYAPTSEATDQEIKEFYEQLQETLIPCSKNVIILGDFNARVGQKIKGEDRILGNSCFGKRDKRGTTLIQFCWENNLFIINSLFEKKNKNLWTWLSPCKRRSQIDYVLSNIKSKFTNFEIINLSFPSDHRLLRSTLLLTKKKKSRTTYKGNKFSLQTKELQEKYIEALKSNLNNINPQENDGIEKYYEKIKQAIDKSLKSISNENKNTKYHFIISDITKDLIKRRNELVNKKQLTSEEKQERSFLFKNIHKIIRKEYQDHRLTKIKKHLNTSRSVKKSLKELATTKKWIPSLNKKYDNKNTFCRNEILKEATEFYKDLYTCKTTSIIETPLTTNNKKLPRFTAQEISLRIKKLKNEKSMGPDNIPNEAISTGITLLTHPLTKLFNKILEERKIPTEWAKSDIILLYKKGDPNDLGNYRPISLQSNLYKLFASCLDKRLEKYTEEFQPVEQAGFRSTYSTIDHIHSLELIIEKYLEMQCPLYLAFIDYAKAFDSISHSSMWSALQECDVPTETIELIQDIYMKSKSKIILDRTGTEIDICRGVRQGDPLSPRIFISVLQNIMKTLKWETKGININGQFLSNLRFADDIVLFAESSSKLESMINEINYISNEIGLELNTTKTKIMTNSILRHQYTLKMFY
ncbi:unnamed protein product [Colias eurytheme]|nr:unnamed protein product [Colias eurytheme]